MIHEQDIARIIKECGELEDASSYTESVNIMRSANRELGASRAIKKLASLMPKWMPIETAPRDGTAVLVSDGNYIAIARYGYSENQEHWDEGEDGFWDSLEGQADDPWYNTLYDDATHFMYLPEPPQEQE